MIQGCLSLREKYAELKAECKKMVPIFGTGKFITTPIVNNDGEPVEGEAGNLNGSMPDTAGVTDKEVIQWKLSLSQIGLYFLKYIFVRSLVRFLKQCLCFSDVA